MSINLWPEQERPREKLLANGARELSDAELLAVLIGSGGQGRNAVELGRDLLSEFGGLRELLEADQKQLCAVHGLGVARFATFKACLELGQRYLLARLQRGDALGSPQDTRRFLESRLRGYSHEVFACLFLDTRNRVISFDEMFHGTIDGASVHPREIVRRAIERNAAGLIIAHNHPSGVAEPSRADRALTRRLREAVELIDVRLLDHFVVGDGEVVSFAERGWI